MSIKQSVQRYMWPMYLILLFSVAAGTLIVEVGMHTGHSHAESLTSITADVNCGVIKKTINVTISKTTFTPDTVITHLCDKVIFYNATGGIIEIAMGPHKQHIAYPGLSDGVMGPLQSKSLVLVSKGTFPLHEHLKDLVNGTLIIEP
jgi:hypothetical protein